MIPQLEHRLGKLEAKLKPRALRAIIEAGDAVISRWWSVSFFEGTREQQEARLKELRQDPQFYKPLNEQEPPVRFQGGAGCEDAYQRIQEERRNQKLTSATAGNLGMRTGRKSKF